MSFQKGHTFKSLFAYTTPSGEEHSQGERSSWTLENGTITFDQVQIIDPFVGNGDRRQVAVIKGGENILVIGSDGVSARYARCIRGYDFLPDVTNGADPPAPPENRSEPETFMDIAPVNLCTDQEIINSTVGPFKQAIGQLALSDQSNPAALFDQTLLEAILIGDRLRASRFKFLRIRNVGTENDGTGTVTIRCKTNLRIVEPIKGSEGAFASYVQFNGASYTVRIKQAGSSDEKAYILAELRPVNGKWDIESGTE